MTEIVCACVRVCVRVCVNIDVFLTLLYYHDQDAKSYNVMIGQGCHKHANACRRHTGFTAIGILGVMHCE